MTKPFWKIQNKAEAETAEMLIYSEISDSTWYGDEVTPRQFADDLQALEGKALKVRINSPGGDVFAAQAIYNQLKDYKGNITMFIDGMAASAATIITCAGDKVVMPDNAIFMIHNPSVMLMDVYEADDMKQMANTMDAIKQTIVNVYEARTGGRLSRNKITRMMDDETWMTAQEALDNGFIDEISAAVDSGNKVTDKGCLIVNSIACDTKRFKNISVLREKMRNQPKNITKNGGKSMDKNELLQTLKDIFTSSQNAEDKEKNAVNAERQRMIALDALDEHNNPVVTKIINAAKANGATADSIKAYIDAVKEAPASNGVAQMQNIIKDQLDSGANNVQSSTGEPASKEDDEAKAKAAATQRIVDLMNEMRG